MTWHQAKDVTLNSKLQTNIYIILQGQAELGFLCFVGLPAQVYQAKFEACPARLAHRKALDIQEPMVMHHHLCPHHAGSDQQVTNRNFDSLRLVFQLVEWKIPEALQGVQ